jgi:four helix bundle protein
MDSYRSLEAWKRAHAAVLLVLEITDKRSAPRTWALFDQLRRAAISVEANIVEGYALGTVNLCRRHFRIAFGSAAEAECLLRVAGERGYLERGSVEDVERNLGATMRALRGLMRSPPSRD